MSHETLLRERAETPADKTHGICVRNFQSWVESVVTDEAFGVKVLAVPGNTAFLNDVDCIDNGILCCNESFRERGRISLCGGGGKGERC